MTRTFLPLVFLLLAAQCPAQTFELTLPFGGTGEESRAAVENSSGHYVVAGSSYQSGQFDVVVAELTSSGAVVTARTLGTPSGELVNGIFQSSDGSYVLAGAVYDNPNNYDWFLMKLDSTLQPVWYKRYGTAGNDYANSCAEISPGHYLVTGTVAHGGSAKPSSVVFDSSGTVLYQGYLTTNQFASPNYRGRYFGNGRTGFCNLANAFSLLDTSGAIVYQLPENFATFTRDAAPEAGGGYFLAGVAGYGGPTGSSAAFGFTDSLLTGLTSLTAYAKSGYDITPAAMVRSSSGNYVAVVSAMSISSGNELPLVMKFNGSGTLLAAYNLLPAGLNSGRLNTVTETSSGGFLVTGMSGIGQGLFIALLDSSATACAATAYTLTASAGSSFAVTPHAAYSAALPAPSVATTAYASVAPAPTVVCNPSAVHATDRPAELRAFPTIFSDKFYVEAGRESCRLVLFDLSGRTVLQQDVRHRAVIACDHLPAGTYVVQLTDPSGLHAAFRMVKTGY
jgi:hypothetical protein